jgi:hypothetical protein
MEGQEKNKTPKVGYTEEAEGVKSANRLVFIVGAFWAMGFTTMMSLMLESVTVTGLVALFAGIFSPIAALKVSQKFAEKK